MSIPQPVEQITQAVQTRSETKATDGITPLITPVIDLGTGDVAKLQSEDETLHRALDSAQQGNNSIYQIHRGVLYRVRKNRRGQELRKLALPKNETPGDDACACRNHEWTPGSPSNSGADYRQFLVARHD